MVKLFLGGFPLEANELELVQMVSPYCTVVTIKIVRDKKTRICKGYAFLEIETEQGAKLAVEELDGAMYKGRELKVAIVEDKPAAPPPRYARVMPRAPFDPEKKRRPRKI
ncbi:RNA recognition motif domain-containing protein [Mucilaginibacter myungsuensis]|uniref:RNA-binding protein n=1 Tax=Mucilaginibacter myungsuensis TaxID=649104 RepID=A0A929L077_9SPHI|nr:RNA-binding protein [Mucilaginibacter myungsuensis]MBE9662099.1 RNA-binding protein [Mucilaginibacter myungsuensis]MDN3599467.1 RNA-binding protein [Mucilaginibacter myungsuensis]